MGWRGDPPARVIGSLRGQPDLAKRVSQIDVADLHNAAVILAGDSAVIQLGEERFLARLQGYVELSDALHERVPEIDSVDLRFDERIYVRPARRARKGARDVEMVSRSAIKR
jgi:hypothetical protein